MRPILPPFNVSCQRKELISKSYVEEVHSSELTSLISDSLHLEGGAMGNPTQEDAEADLAAKAAHRRSSLCGANVGMAPVGVVTGVAGPGSWAGGSFEAMSGPEGLVKGAGARGLGGHSASKMSDSEMTEMLQEAEGEDVFPETDPSNLRGMHLGATQRSNHSQLITALLMMATSQTPELLLGLYELTGELTNQGQTLVAYARTTRESRGEFAIKCGPL
jgi:hypothetical protein